MATAGSAVLLTDPRCLDSEWSERPDGNRGRGRGDSKRSLQRLTLSMGLGWSPAGDLSLIVDVSEVTMSAGLQRTLGPEAAGRGPGPKRAQWMGPRTIGAGSGLENRTGRAGISAGRSRLGRHSATAPAGGAAVPTRPPAQAGRLAVVCHHGTCGSWPRPLCQRHASLAAGLPLKAYIPHVVIVPYVRKREQGVDV